MPRILPAALISILTLAACASHKPEYVKADATYEETSQQLAQCQYEVELAKDSKDQKLVDKCMSAKGWMVKKD